MKRLNEFSITSTFCWFKAFLNAQTKHVTLVSVLVKNGHIFFLLFFNRAIFLIYLNCFVKGSTACLWNPTWWKSVFIMLFNPLMNRVNHPEKFALVTDWLLKWPIGITPEGLSLLHGRIEDIQYLFKNSLSASRLIHFWFISQGELFFYIIGVHQIRIISMYGVLKRHNQ